MDLAFAFYIPLNMNMNARELSSVTLTNALLDNLEISMDELVEAAADQKMPAATICGENRPCGE